MNMQNGTNLKFQGCVDHYYYVIEYWLYKITSKIKDIPWI